MSEKEKCAAIVQPGFPFNGKPHRCINTAFKDGLCKVHHPDFKRKPKNSTGAFREQVDLK